MSPLDNGGVFPRDALQLGRDFGRRLAEGGAANLGELLRRRALLVTFELAKNIEPVVKLIEKYSDVPMSLADACVVRMTETLGDPVVLTTDEDFRAYRRHSRQVVPCVTPE